MNEQHGVNEIGTLESLSSFFAQLHHHLCSQPDLSMHT